MIIFQQGQSRLTVNVLIPYWNFIREFLLQPLELLSFLIGTLILSYLWQSFFALFLFSTKEVENSLFWYSNFFYNLHAKYDLKSFNFWFLSLEL